MCRIGKRGGADITDSNLFSQKQLDIKPIRIYYILYDIMGEMGNSFNFKKPFTIWAAPHSSLSAPPTST